MIVNKLEKCPFCGSNAAMFESIRYKNDPEIEWIVYGVECQNKDCIAHQDQKFYSTEEQAMKAWNTRV